ncbi:MAG: hypothetical protein K8R57_04615 [Verrucomicrobia bacterium]|nr:hypothetical protein [Verrucomicrobiota bacterium]
MRPNFVIIMCDQQLRYLDRVQDSLRGDCWAGRPWRTNPPIHFTIA